MKTLIINNTHKVKQSAIIAVAAFSFLFFVASAHHVMELTSLGLIDWTK